MSKKVCISGYYGFDNFGDETILQILINNLKEVTGKENITVFSSSPQKTSMTLDVKSVQSFDLCKVLFSIIKADVLISGGGSLLQDVTSKKSLIYYLFVIFLAVFFNKDVIIFAQGIGPINSKFLQSITKFLLKRACYITVRDEKSLFLLRGWGLKPILVSDPLWGLQTEMKLPLNKVGIQLRGWKYLSDEFIHKLAREVNNNFANMEIDIYSFQDAQDLDTCKKFQNFLILLNPHIKTNLLFNKTNNEIIESFRELNYLIAMRFHACLLGIKYGIPTLPVSYDEKVEKLAQETEINYVSVENYEYLTKYIKDLQDINTCKSYNKTFDFTELNNILKD